MIEPIALPYWDALAIVEAVAEQRDYPRPEPCSTYRPRPQEGSQ